MRRKPENSGAQSEVQQKCRAAWVVKFQGLISMVIGLALAGAAMAGIVTASQALDRSGQDGQEVESTTVRPRVDDTGWRYTQQAPPEDWMSADFDDAHWTQAKGGFGTRGTPGARISTIWDSSDIWLRKTVTLEEVPENLALLIHHDEDAVVYLNGIEIASLSGYVTSYQTVPLDEAARQAARVGDNLLAVTCHQTVGGQFIDAHLIDADNPPELLPVQVATEPFVSHLVTPWGEDVGDQPWSQYPRPTLVRTAWTNLNGWWNYQITADAQRQRPEQWEGKIRVPFALESRLSGVQRLLNPDRALWYQRTFELEPQENHRWLLHFEAVDYECQVWVNGQSVGWHRGGNTPFYFDITAAVKEGENELLVRVIDRTEAMQLRGKQVLEPHAIWYTQVSGIWQTVWLEPVPKTFVSDLKIQTSAQDGTIQVQTLVDGEGQHPVRVTVRDGNRVVATATGQAGDPPVRIPVESAKLWSPDHPFLYDLEVELLDAQQQVVDRVFSYAGIRSVGKMQDEDGHWRMTLNGEPLFHWGTLDQGWWPDGLLTPPSDEAMRFDVDYLKAAGFNMIRKHIKVEPRRYYEYCDRVGMLVWQDHVSGGISPPWTRLARNPVDADWSQEDHRQFMLELERMIDRLENHPSIVVWVPFNEAWGQHRTLDVGTWTVQRDPSRLVNVASGGNFWPVGDIVDHHEYPHPAFPFNPRRDRNYVMVVGEFGGHGLPVPGHLWNPEMDNWGYGGLPQNAQEYLERYQESLRRLVELKSRGIAAGVYTQTTDVEGEINGLLTYDRRQVKIPAEQLRKIHEQAGLIDPAE